jgi:folate-dependent phosphoribosylglycinamide formyltransferase PurN
LRLLIISSGKGGNAHAVVAAVESGSLPNVELAGVIHGEKLLQSSDLREKLQTTLVDFEKLNDEDFAREIRAYRPELIVLNYDRIVSKRLLQIFPREFISLHYSFLPAHKGMWLRQICQSTITGNLLSSGVTLHELSTDVDGGRPLSQALFPVQRDDTVSTVQNYSFRLGAFLTLIYLRSASGPSVQQSSFSMAQFLGREILLSSRSAIANIPGLTDPQFWEQLDRYLADE